MANLLIGACTFVLLLLAGVALADEERGIAAFCTVCGLMGLWLLTV